MAKQLEDKYTLDAFQKPSRGRPRKPDALTNAQRQKRFRQKRANLKAEIFVTSNGNLPDSPLLIF